ncbi:MAG TPA: serine hydrolase [Thermoanaerobaculia bacterium]|nr:serine hydrolase [Thermoanaerobaculia bacterium]
MRWPVRGARRGVRAFALLGVLGLAGCATTGRGGKPSPIDAAVDAASRRCACRIGVAARHLESGWTYERNGAEEFESASVIKIAIVTEAMARVRDGTITLSDRWTLTEEKKADGSGTLLILDAGLNPTWSDLVTLMIGPSDNTATNAWIGRLGIDAINARMAGMGLPHIRLFAMLPSLAHAHDNPSPWLGFRLGAVTPSELADWMGRVARGEILDAEASRRIFEYLDKDPTRQRIARRFPSEMLWAGKSGSMRGVRNDAGILRTKKGRFVLVVLTDGSKADAVSSADHPSVVAIADVAKAIVDTWSRDLPDIADKPK